MNKENISIQEVENELSEAEVNVYARCSTHAKIACMVDCPDLTAWLTAAL